MRTEMPSRAITGSSGWWSRALLLRGSREFGSQAEYARFLKALFAQRNAGRRARLAEEMAVMRELPARRMESAKREQVKVDSGSLIHVERNSYSVNSRLIGARMEARSYLDHVEVWYGQRKIEDLPRLRGRGKHRIDYRHIIEWLGRKPGAFENYRYQEDPFPTSRFRMAYDAFRVYTYGSLNPLVQTADAASSRGAARPHPGRGGRGCFSPSLPGIGSTGRAQGVVLQLKSA